MEWNDMPDVEEIEVKGRKKKTERTPEEALKEGIYNRRCRLVLLSKADYSKFLLYLHDNETFFKTKMSEAEKEDMRRTCERAWSENQSQATMDDIDLFDRTFGYYVHPNVSRQVPVCDYNGIRRGENDPYKLPIDRQVAWFTDCLYQRFIEWIGNPDTIAKLRGHKELEERLMKAIDENRFRNHVMFRTHRGYDPKDEELFARALESVRTVDR